MRGYQVTRAGPFFEVLGGTVEAEIRSGNTVTFLHEVDLSEVEEVRSGAGALRPSYTAFVAKAVALALRAFPYANRRLYRSLRPFASPRIQQFDTCDLAIACERDVDGAECATFVDVLRDADVLSLGEMNRWLQALAACDTSNNAQWRSMFEGITRAPPFLARTVLGLPRFFPSLWEKWRGGAVLISSPAKYGVDSVVGSWTSPLGVSFGLVRDRALVRDGQVSVRPSFNFTLNFDRRVMAGAQAGRFFARIVQNLEQPRRTMVDFLPTVEAPAPIRLKGGGRG